MPRRFRHGGYDIFDMIFRSVYLLLQDKDILHSFNHRPASSISAWLVSKTNHVEWWTDWADLWGKGGIADRRYGFLRWLTSSLDTHLEKWVITHCPNITAISHYLIKKSRFWRQGSKNIYFLPVGADTDLIKPLPKLEARQQLKLNRNDFLGCFLYVGTYDADFLSQILLQVHLHHVSFKLMMLGPFLDDFYCQLPARPHPIYDRIVHPGVVSRTNLSAWLSAADVALLPYRNLEINRGRYPNKLGDYLAAGKPIVANPTGEVKRLLAKYDIGWTASESPRKFAQLLETVGKDKRQINSKSKNALKLAGLMSWMNVASSLERLYQSR